MLFRAEQEINLHPGFTAEEGSRFLAVIENICSSSETSAKSQTDSTKWLRIDEESRNDAATNDFEEIPILDDFNVMSFPNPFNDVFSIAIKNLENYSEDERATIVIRDLNGKVVVSQTCAVEDLDLGIEINTLGLAKGIFIVQIDLQNTRYFTRVVKS